MIPWFILCSLADVFVKLIVVLHFNRDRFRTMVNVFGDAVGAGVVAHLSRKELGNFENNDLTSSKSTIEGKHLSIS